MFDFTSIQDILKKEQSKIIIVEEGKPSYVLLSIEEYRALIERKDLEDFSRNHKVTPAVEEISHSKGETSSMPSLGEPYLEERYKSHGIKLEDLPF